VVARQSSIIQFLAPLAVAADSRFDLLGTCLLDVSLLLSVVVLARTLVPLLLPVGQRCFGTLQRIRRGSLGMLRLLEARDQLIERQLELRNFRFVLVDVLDYLFCTEDRLLEVLLLPLAEFIGVFDRLFEPRDLGPYLVIPALDFVEQIRPFRLTNPGALDTGFEFSLCRNLLFEARLALVEALPCSDCSARPSSPGGRDA
jgi:hypothetical protein